MGNPGASRSPAPPNAGETGAGGVGSPNSPGVAPDARTPDVEAPPVAGRPPRSDPPRAKPLEQVLRGVLDAMPGTLLDVEPVHDAQKRPRYRVKILTQEDVVRSVVVDATSGSILSTE